MEIPHPERNACFVDHADRYGSHPANYMKYYWTSWYAQIGGLFSALKYLDGVGVSVICSIGERFSRAVETKTDTDDKKIYPTPATLVQPVPSSLYTPNLWKEKIPVQVSISGCRDAPKAKGTE